MHRAPPHVPRVLLPHLRDARVILDRQIALVLPFDVENVLVLCSRTPAASQSTCSTVARGPARRAASLRGEVEGAKGTVL